MPVRLEKVGKVGVIVLDRPPANSYVYTFLREFASAIDDAIGIPGGVTRLPATPQRVKALLRRRQQRAVP